MFFSNRNAFDIVWSNDLLFLCVLIMQKNAVLGNWINQKPHTHNTFSNKLFRYVVKIFAMAATVWRSPVGCDTFVAYPPDAPPNTVIFGKNSDRPAGEGQSIRQYPGGTFEPWWELEKWSAILSPGKSTWNLKMGDLVQMIFLFNYRWFLGSMLIFKGVMSLVSYGWCWPIVTSRQTCLEILQWNCWRNLLMCWCLGHQRGWCVGGLPQLIVDRCLQDWFNHEGFRNCCFSFVVVVVHLGGGFKYIAYVHPYLGK